jgi:hypothetical protein
MQKLYTVTFTTSKEVKKYDQRGKMIGTSSFDVPVRIDELTEDKAMAYSGNENFKMVEFDASKRIKFATKGDSRQSSIGNGTKGVIHSRVDTTLPVRTVAVKSGSSAKHKAAASGDLSQAISS